MTWDQDLQEDQATELTGNTNEPGPGIWELTWDLGPGMTVDQDLQDDQATGWTGDANDRRCQPPETTASAKTTENTTRTFGMIWDLRPGSALTPGTNDSGPGVWELTWD
jgi:hypothetical protein